MQGDAKADLNVNIHHACLLCQKSHSLFLHVAWREFVHQMLITKEEARKGLMGMENWEQQRRLDTSLCTMSWKHLLTN